MDKFGLNYQCFIQVPGGDTITVGLPFTVEFDITKNTLTSANICQIRLYNLSERNRGLIRKNITNYGDLRLVELRAGYGKNLSRIFTGSITQAWSVREGVNFITQIECLDGGFAFTNGVTNLQFPANTTQKTVITEVMKTLPGVEVGAVGNFPGSLTRANSYTGNPATILDELTGGGFFINNNKAFALNNNEYVATDGILRINSGTGLLGTPVLERDIVRAEMLFEPAADIGRKASVTSLTESNFNGDYKITAVKHRGMISEAVAGSATTTVEFFFTKLLEGVS